MRKIVLSGLFAMLVSVSANASDGGAYIETETYTNHVKVNNAVVSVNETAPAVVTRPCAHVAEPVRVKTHTEVIDHYQVYRPVTVYQPAGTYSERRVVTNAPCSRCNW